MKLPHVPLEINLVNSGICHLGDEGATGKTYVGYLLKQQNGRIPGYALVLTYEQGLSEKYYIERIQQFEGSIIFLDRADLYVSDSILEALSAKSCIRLMDMKNFLKWNKVAAVLCDITMTADGVVIEELI